MNTSPEKFLASAKSSAEARVNEIAAASDSVLSAVEHLTALNLNTTRAVLDDAIALGQAVAAARDPKALFELQIGAVTPALQKGYTWFKTVGDLAGLAEHVHRQLAQTAPPRRPLDLVGQRRAVNTCVIGVRQHPERAVTHQSEADLCLGDALADQRIMGSTIGLGRCDDRLISHLHSLLQAIAPTDRRGHAVDHDGTGHFAALMAAHAVGDHPQAQLRTAEHAVFIVSADQARHTAAGILHVDGIPFEDWGQSSGAAECIRWLWQVI